MSTEVEESGAAITGIIFNKDGSFQRVPAPIFPDVPPNPSFDNGVASKDIILDKKRNLWVRIFLPADDPNKTKEKPVLVYFHGGGFVILQPSTSHFHKLCELMAVKLECIVVSVGYRLAPEHILPAAYEDGYSALEWLDVSAKKQPVTEPWLDTADFSRVFVAGDSAGGNLAHHVSVRAAHQPGRLSFKVAGQILLQPFFGGVPRTKSELSLNGSPVITLASCDLCWKVALPEGANRDHAYCNPALELPKVMEKGFAEKTLVVVGGLDLLKDRQLEYAKIVEEGGRKVKLVVYEKADHAFYAFGDGGETKFLFDELASFISRNFKQSVAACP